MNGPPKRRSAGIPLFVGFAAIILMVGTLGAWSVGTRISGAVVAPSVVEVQRERQVIQHPDGGVVGAILARDGDHVAAGDVLVRLDGTFLHSELAIVEQQLAEIFARSARLTAERDGAETPDFGDLPDFDTVDAGALTELIEGQRNLFEARGTTLAQEWRQLAEQQTQIERQIDGMEAQLGALRRQLELISDEVEAVRTLFDRGLVQGPRLSELRREEARLQGEIGNLTALVAEAGARIAGLAIESLRLGERRREEAIARLRDLGFSRIELQERRLSLRERLARLDVRAPVPGVVFASRVVAEQSVVRPADPMMYIVPGGQPLQVSARIDPIDIDQVHPGQDVALMFTTFNRRTMPEVPGTVLRVSADAETDEARGITYYQAVILPNETALAAMPDLALLPGMPVEAFLRTGDRTPLSFLTHPLTVYFQRAFREE
ncbi:HlyD family type I secretion periplasmic adaptor subunit [Roseibacterium sp. SDUM158017]|uniref:HlyD family type I secretion periplasmic adaptor subunit n=1 Tax=Roseicyclus salinarum TaxID=3036773 RepID=UPI002415768F|nr:HlyD family type I secretion periplasmic adaptor subunit [Roseibacterium sp. SDUM158017]MDG4649278.1 HlyD family type I secretion periplasmic adaptor subunit [Roseibacterium sp. SDUM158017]